MSKAVQGAGVIFFRQGELFLITRLTIQVVSSFRIPYFRPVICNKLHLIPAIVWAPRLARRAQRQGGKPFSA